VGQHPCFKDADSLAAAILGKFVAQAALANSGLADHPDHPAIASRGIFEFASKRGKLFTSAGEGAQPYAAAKHAAGGCVLQSPELEYLDWRREPANSLRAEGFDFDELPGGRVRLFETRMLPGSASCSRRLARCTLAPAAS